MGNPLSSCIIFYILLNLSPIISKQIQLVELDANTFMKIATFPPKDDYVVLFYANWDIASNQIQSIFLNVAKTVTLNNLNGDDRKIIFAKFSCGRYPHMCTKYNMHSIPAILYFTNVILDQSSENGIPHSTKYAGNLNIYEQVQDFVEIWHYISSLIRLYNEYANKLISSWSKSSKNYD